MSRSRTPNRDTDPIIAQHSHFFTPRIPNKPGYYIFINPHLNNTVSNRICRSIVNNIVPNYDVQQVWMHHEDTMSQWGLRGMRQEVNADKTHYIDDVTGTYFSKYNVKHKSYMLFSSVIILPNHTEWVHQKTDLRIQ